jgi:hypothetical protein
MDYNLDLNLKKIKLGDIIALQEGDLKAARSFIATCMVDDEGKSIEYNKAIELLNDVDLETFQGLVLQLTEAINKNPLPVSGAK